MTEKIKLKMLYKFGRRSCLIYIPFFFFFHSDKSARLIEQSRCLSHLSHVYHSLHLKKWSLMAALQELNAAEEAEENLHEVCLRDIGNVSSV